MPFSNRVEAGRQLAARLSDLGFARQDVVVLGLPRGGVVVAFEVAHALRAPLDVLVVRKLGVPAMPEVAMGAIGEGGVRVLNKRVLARVSPGDLAAVEEREHKMLDQRVTKFRSGNTPAMLKEMTALIIDDGIATGSTARAACQVARAQGANRVVLAIPVGPRQQLSKLQGEADEVICLKTPSRFSAVGEFYLDFAPVSDQEVSTLLSRSVAD